MSDSILNTNGQNEIDNDLVFVGAKQNGQYMTGFTDKIFVIDLENLPDPLNPLHLPSNTVRVRTNDGNAPVIDMGKATHATYDTAVLVPGTTDVYDVYKSGSSFENLFYWSINIVEVLGANSKGITNMQYMFKNCEAFTTISTVFDTSSVTNMLGMFHNCELLLSVPLFDTSNVTSMRAMFEFNYELTSIPLFNTSKVTDMDSMFAFCNKVQSGALALYQQASSQSNPPTSHNNTFYNCGKDTETGAAELAQIPYEWR